MVKSAWDAVDIERIRTATDPSLSADVAAVLITVRGPIIGDQKRGPLPCCNSAMRACWRACQQQAQLPHVTLP